MLLEMICLLLINNRCVCVCLFRGFVPRKVSSFASPAHDGREKNQQKAAATMITITELLFLEASQSKATKGENNNNFRLCFSVIINGNYVTLLSLTSGATNPRIIICCVFTLANITKENQIQGNCSLCLN